MAAPWMAPAASRGTPHTPFHGACCPWRAHQLATEGLQAGPALRWLEAVRWRTRGRIEAVDRRPALALHPRWHMRGHAEQLPIRQRHRAVLARRRHASARARRSSAPARLSSRQRLCCMLGTPQSCAVATTLPSRKPSPAVRRRACTHAHSSGVSGGALAEAGWQPAAQEPCYKGGA